MHGKVVEYFFQLLTINLVTLTLILQVAKSVNLSAQVLVYCYHKWHIKHLTSIMHGKVVKYFFQFLTINLVTLAVTLQVVKSVNLSAQVLL